MRSKSGIGTGPTLEEALEDVRRRNQQMTPEFVDMFIDVIYRMVIEILEEEKPKELEQARA